MRRPTVAVVTALTPSSTTLAEYGLHLLSAFGRKSGIRVIALVEDVDLDYPTIPGVEIRRAWRFDSPLNPVLIAREARRASADVVVFNAHFTSFGSTKVGAALGLASPVATRLSGIPVITLLHNIVEAVDLGAAGFGESKVLERALRAIGSAITWMVLRSNVVTTTMPNFVEILRDKYGARNVALTPHGAFDAPAPPQAPPRHPTVMAFGKFGTYKKVEGLIDAVRRLGRDDIRIVIAGTDSPNTRGYLADVEARLGGPDLVFTGYVAEDEVEGIFRDATLTVFPYTATTGSSGVLHQAGSYGCAPVLPRIGDLEGLIQAEGFTGVFFDPEDVEDLSRAIGSLIDDEPERARIAAHNYGAAAGLTIDEVADWYLVHIGRLVCGDGRALLVESAVSVTV